jgi:hypothetical protein
MVGCCVIILSKPFGVFFFGYVFKENSESVEMPTTMW